jgi:hypothetical protein
MKIILISATLLTTMAQYTVIIIETIVYCLS